MVGQSFVWVYTQEWYNWVLIQMDSQFLRNWVGLKLEAKPLLSSPNLSHTHIQILQFEWLVSSYVCFLLLLLFSKCTQSYSSIHLSLLSLWPQTTGETWLDTPIRVHKTIRVYGKSMLVEGRLREKPTLQHTLVDDRIYLFEVEVHFSLASCCMFVKSLICLSQANCIVLSYDTFKWPF